jgi:ABC-2 type transport system permease protein
VAAEGASSQSTGTSSADGPRAGNPGAVGHGLRALRAILGREIADLLRNPGTLIANLVVPTVLLLVASAGFSDAFGRALIDPYDTYVTFAVYSAPGLAGLVILLAVVRSTLAMTHEPGAASMRFLMAAPLPRWFLLFSRLLAVAVLATFQAAIFVVIARIAGVYVDAAGWLIALPAVVLSALVLAALMLALVVFLRPLRRYPATMMFVVLPAYFVSSALYPLWKFTDYGADYLRVIATANPFTHVVELVRFATERQFEPVALAVVVGVGVAAFAAALVGSDPRWGRMVWGRRRRWSETVPEEA